MLLDNTNKNLMYWSYSEAWQPPRAAFISASDSSYGFWRYI